MATEVADFDFVACQDQVEGFAAAEGRIVVAFIEPSLAGIY